MAFIKSIIFTALVAFVAAQINLEQQMQQIGNITGQETPAVPTDQLPTDLPTDQIPTDQAGQLGQVTNATSGITGENPALPIDQVPVGQVSTEAPSAETPSRFTNAINRVTNGLQGMRGNRRHHH